LPVVYIITGSVRSGKTTLLKQLIRLLKQKKINVMGYLSDPVHKNNTNAGYDLLEINTGKSFPFLRLDGEKDWERIGPYYFIPSGFKRAEQIILGSSAVDVLVVDEVGPLELKGRGLWPALKEEFSQNPDKILLVVRDKILKNIVKKIENEGCEVKIFNIQDKNTLTALIKTLSPN
jgi:nucleoside-triphosphatase THEP1